MRKYLPRTLPEDEQAHGLQLIEQREEQTRAQLAEIESVIAQLQSK